MHSPPSLRYATDAVGFVLTLTVGAVSVAALCIAGQYERIMSGHMGALICGAAYGFFGCAYFLSSLIVTATKPSSRCTSLLSSTIWRGVILLTGIALVGYLSTVFPAVKKCNADRKRYSYGGPAENCLLPLAAGILGWISVGAIFAALGYEGHVLRKRYGSTRRTWRASLTGLEAGEDAASLNPHTKV